MPRILVLVEGQTEERFVKTILAPHLEHKNIYISPTLITTKKVISGPNFKGGILSYDKVKPQIINLLRDTSAYTTTFFDYYALPEDFPGWIDSGHLSGINRLIHIENQIFQDMNCPRNFKPFIMRHEFEAFVFVEPETTARVLTPSCIQSVPEQAIYSIRQQFSTPEDINLHRETAPSKRITAICNAYKKVIHGSIITQRVGIDKLRKECPHFNDWVSWMESLS